jgi:hypothetical protein
MKDTAKDTWGEVGEGGFMSSWVPSSGTATYSAIWKLLESWPLGILWTLHCTSMTADRLGGETQQGLSVGILLGLSLQHSFL